MPHSDKNAHRIRNQQRLDQPGSSPPSALRQTMAGLAQMREQIKEAPMRAYVALSTSELFEPIEAYAHLEHSVSGPHAHMLANPLGAASLPLSVVAAKTLEGALKGFDALGQMMRRSQRITQENLVQVKSELEQRQDASAESKSESRPGPG